MIGHKKLDGVRATKGEDSWEWHSQCVGKPVHGMDIWRVINRPFCRKHNALDDVIWKGVPLTKIYGLDPAYGEGDRCVGRLVEFGQDMNGKIILRVGIPDIIRIDVKSKIDPEDQIAAYVHSRLNALSVPPANCFYDSFGRGTLGFSFSKLFGANCPIPVDSGAQPSNRPVRFDLFVEDKSGAKRLKRCDEHYKKFISEMWFSVREVIDCDQLKNLDVDTMAEGCSRKFTAPPITPKTEVEPKKDMKERINRSPDLFDNLAICVEGARQRGFKITNESLKAAPKKGVDWLEARLLDEKRLRRERQLELA
jgi:hypothetical protein